MRKLKRFNMKFLKPDPYTPFECIRKAGGEPADIDSLLKYPNFITLHVRLENSDKTLISEREFFKPLIEGLY
jgi:phosphoglycerate dehydrogenase-like enzyme